MTVGDPYQWSGISAANFSQYPDLLMKSGLWDLGVQGNPYAGGSDGGDAPAYSFDPSAFNGYQVGQYIDGGTVNQVLRDAQGNIVGSHSFAQPHTSLTGSDYGTMAGIAAAVLGGGALASGGLSGLSALGAGDATAALGAGQVGALDAGAAASGLGAEAGGGLATFGGLGGGTGGASFAVPALESATGGGLNYAAAGLTSTPGFSVPSALTSALSSGGDYASLIKSVASLAGGLGSAYSQGQAGQQASQLQQQAALAGQQQLAPYAQAGTSALKAQQDLAGLNGAAAQQAAIDQLKASPQFTSQLDLGERSILANASATGGLRGGNTQAALAQFSPSLLASTINQQYGMLGQMASNGQNAASGVSNLIQQGGSAAAGGALATGKANSGYWSALSNAAGLYAGLSGW